MDNTNTNDGNNGSMPADPTQTPAGDAPMTPPPVADETPVAEETPVTPEETPAATEETPAMPAAEPEAGTGDTSGGTPSGTM